MLGNQMYPMTQMLCLNDNTVFQDSNAPIFTTGTVQLWWFEKQEGELQHLASPFTVFL
jgi:hypothetical protein